MPIYEFFCKKCKKTTEVNRKIEDMRKPYRCSKCGSRRTEKLISLTNFEVTGDNAANGYGLKSKGKKK